MQYRDHHDPRDAGHRAGGRGQYQRDHRPRRDGDRQCDRQRHRRAGSDVGARRHRVAHRRGAWIGHVRHRRQCAGRALWRADAEFRRQLHLPADNNNAVVQAAGRSTICTTLHLHGARHRRALRPAQIDIDITGANDPPIANPDAVSAKPAASTTGRPASTRPATPSPMSVWP